MSIKPARQKGNGCFILQNPHPSSRFVPFRPRRVPNQSPGCGHRVGSCVYAWRALTNSTMPSTHLPELYFLTVAVIKTGCSPNLLPSPIPLRPLRCPPRRRRPRRPHPRHQSPPDQRNHRRGRGIPLPILRDGPRCDAWKSLHHASGDPVFGDLDAAVRFKVLPFLCGVVFHLSE